MLKIKRLADVEFDSGKVLLWYGTAKENLAEIMRNGFKSMATFGATTAESGIHFTDCFSHAYLTNTVIFAANNQRQLSFSESIGNS